MSIYHKIDREKMKRKIKLVCGKTITREWKRNKQRRKGTKFRDVFIWL